MVAYIAPSGRRTVLFLVIAMPAAFLASFLARLHRPAAPAGKVATKKPAEH
jgi:hypothetical protein